MKIYSMGIALKEQNPDANTNTTGACENSLKVHIRWRLNTNFPMM
jgi:hypothetical protein